jgi:hypothetical protein
MIQQLVRTNPVIALDIETNTVDSGTPFGSLLHLIRTEAKEKQSTETRTAE